MFIHNINPAILSIFGLEIRYYGMVYVIGFLLVLFILLKQNDKLRLTKDEIYDYIFYSIIFVILGARLFEILFYQPSYYFSNPLQMIMIWKGGLSFHGGLAGIVIWTYFFARKKKIHFYDLTDILVIPAALILFVGRIANFINGELVGRITNVSWAVKFPNYEEYRHPSQIYEALKNLLIFFVLFFLRNKNLKKGTLTWLFVLMYGILRFLIEFSKEPTSYVLGIPTGQIFSFLMIIAGGYFLLRK
ncbi:prolipoprotein diacylglyceryl transferase [Candidatus Woesearchaeota archaeon]|nr:prolipoprotein diacylglyceryl transferase [Candidatus Woesearchaeota archaeon]